MSIEFSELPYATDALEPHISARTLEFHHGKHHKGYVDKLNKAIDGSGYADKSLTEIIAAARRNSDGGVFNNAAQAWNHAFLWNSMSPDGGGKPGGKLAEAISASFGNLDAFRKAFSTAAASQFGSGWVWLVQTRDGLRIVTTGNADTPDPDTATPLLTLDVWEHAYYLDYQNRRGAYIDAFLEHLVNWDFGEENYSK